MVDAWKILKNPAYPCELMSGHVIIRRESDWLALPIQDTYRWSAHRMITALTPCPPPFSQVSSS